MKQLIGHTTLALVFMTTLLLCACKPAMGGDIKRCAFRGDGCFRYLDDQGGVK